MSQEQMASLAQIVQGIKNNPSSETSQQMLRILKQNPQIMAAIIKRRQQREMSAANGGANGGSIQFGNSCQQQQQDVMTQQPIMANVPPAKTLAEIMQKIKDTPVDENSQRMLHILKQNPPQREINPPAGEADDGALQELQQMMEDMMMNK